MRRRLVLAFVSLTILVVVLYGVPRAFIRIEQTTDREQEQVDTSVVLLSRLVGAEEAAGRQVNQAELGGLLRPGEHVEYVAADGATISAGEAAGSEVGVEASAPVAGGGSLTLNFSQEALDERIRTALLPLITIGLGLVFLAWLLALLLARPLTRPFQELASLARRLGSGNFDLDVPRYEITEADEIGQALSSSARDLDQLIQRERNFAVHASHELRTPLTAARLRLEDLSLWPAASPEVSAEVEEVLAELTRLDTAVAALLERDRDHRVAAADEVDLGQHLTAAADRWRPALERQGRDLSIDVGRGLRARLSPASLTEILDALLGHATDEGEGAVAVAATATPEYLEIRVRDESRRPAGGEILLADPAAEVRSLPRAADLAAVAGGHLSTGNTDLTTFVLRLPRARYDNSPSQGQDGVEPGG